MSAVTLAQYTGTDGSRWDFPDAPQSEAAECRSSFPHPQMVTGRAHCQVDHAEMCTTVHGSMVGGLWFTWSTRQAAVAWARVDTCTYVYCPEIVPAGRPYCTDRCARLDKGTADNRESEAAA